jgi:hypothetical protein
LAAGQAAGAVRQVPRAPLAVQDGGERAVGSAALGRAGRVVGRRADQRVRERHFPGADAQQPALLGVRQLRDVRPGLRACGGDRDEVVAAVGGRDEQGAPGERGELLDPPGERGAEPRPRRDRQLEVRDARALVGRQRRRQLDQRERVPAGRVGQRCSHRRRQVRRRAPEQLERSRAVERAEPQLGEPRALERGVRRLAHRQRDPHLSGRPARGVHHALARGGVEPLDVVDDRYDGALGGRRAQQPDGGDADREPVARRRRAERERRAERRRLRRGQRGEVVDQRREQVRQRREGELGLGLDAARTQDGGAGAAARDQRVEQRRLADARLPAYDERPPPPGVHRVDQLVEHAQLCGAAHDHRGRTYAQGAASASAPDRSGSARVDPQLRDLLAAILELDLEDARDLGRKRDRDRPARRHVLHQVVAVDVDVVGDVGAHAEGDGLALLEAQLRDLAWRDERRLRLGGRRRLRRLGRGLVLRRRPGRRGGRLGARVSGLLLVVVPAAEHNHGDDRDHEGDREEREALRAGHARRI